MRVWNGWQTYLEFRVLGDVIECGDMKLEFSGFAEFPKASAESDEIRTCDRDGQTHGRFRDIVDLVLVQSEAVWLVLAIDEVDEIPALMMNVAAARTGWWFTGRTM